ncbi:uncharacterized protein [Asterias amurensis]|uniref:uncharacterized protein isoform X1 n=1 Tax=Asterias amurensis TaxID=7602 RepID=UPI003AB276B2
MAEIENLQQEIDSCGKEQIEQHVEEEIVHELVSSEQQSWRLDAADETTPPIEVPDEEDTEEDGQQHDEPGRHIIAIDGRVPCGIPGDPDENEEDPQDDEGDDSYDGHGVFFLDSEDEVKQKVSDYEKNTGTHFIMLKKEKGYSQTAEGMGSASDNLVRHIVHPSGETAEEFSCDECEMVYKNYKSLWQHKRDNHQDKISCGYCDYVSSRMYNIKQHRKRRHPNMPDPFDPNISDLFHGAYVEDSRFEYQPEEDLDSGEPLPKIANMSRRNFNFVEASDISDKPVNMQANFVHGNNEERQMHQQRPITTTAYPVGITTSREPFTQSGSHLRQPQSVRSQATTSLLKRSDGNLVTTSSTLPRITSVTGSQVQNTQLNRTPISPKVNFTRMQPSTSSSRESNLFHAPPVNSHQHRRECQEGVSQMDERHRTNPVTSMPGIHHQILTQNTNSSLRHESSRNTSSSQMPVKMATYHNPNHNPSQENLLNRRTSSITTSTCNNSRNTGQNNATITSVLINRDSEKQKHQSILSAYSPSRSNNTLSVDRQQRVSNDASKGARQQPSKFPQQVASPQGGPSSSSPVESTRMRKPTSCPPQDPQSPPQPKPQRSVRSVINEHRQEVGLTDFRSLLKNFHVRSITERVVHPDGTRYEIQIDGEEIDE